MKFSSRHKMSEVSNKKLSTKISIFPRKFQKITKIIYSQKSYFWIPNIFLVSRQNLLEKLRFCVEIIINVNLNLGKIDL